MAVGTAAGYGSLPSGNFQAEIYSQKVLKFFRRASVVEDITNTDFNVGDRVEIFGKNNDINKVAKSINTIAYELISSISNRVVRVYLKD